MGEILFKNSFGVIDQDKVVIHKTKEVKTIPISKIEILTVKRKRNWFFALFGLIAGIAILILGFAASSKGPEVFFTALVISILAFLIGLAHYIGHHEIALKGQNLDLKIKVEMSKTKEGQDFYHSLKKVVY